MIRVVVDSSADLGSLAPSFDVVPFRIRFGDGSVAEVGGDDDLWRRRTWRESGNEGPLPEIVAPTASAYLATFRRLAADGADGIVAITPSARLSASHQSAVLAAEHLDRATPIRVIDSGTLSVPYGLIAMTAATASSAGATLDAVVAKTVGELGKHATLIVVDTVEHLRRGKRMNGWQAVLASALDLKPMLSVVGDTVAPAGSVRGRRRALEVMIDRVVTTPHMSLTIVHAAADDVEAFAGRLVRRTGLEAPIAELGPTLAVHTGPGAIGLVARSG